MSDRSRGILVIAVLANGKKMWSRKIRLGKNFSVCKNKYYFYFNDSDRVQFKCKDKNLKLKSKKKLESCEVELNVTMAKKFGYCLVTKFLCHCDSWSINKINLHLKKKKTFILFTKYIVSILLLSITMNFRKVIRYFCNLFIKFLIFCIIFFAKELCHAPSIKRVGRRSMLGSCMYTNELIDARIFLLRNKISTNSVVKCVFGMWH